jgi:hypothetical protein
MKIYINQSIKGYARQYVIGTMKAHNIPYELEYTEGQEKLEDGRLLDELTRADIIKLKKAPVDNFSEMA